jgi:hypothetical protein
LTTASVVGYVPMRIAKVVGLGAAEDEPFFYVVLGRCPATGSLPS